MSDQEHEYHPAVEEVMETSGVDVGRIKDVDVAKVVGKRELGDRDAVAEYEKNDPLAPTEEAIKADIDEIHKLEIAKKSVERTSLTHLIARNAVSGDHMHDMEAASEVSVAEHNAKDALESYDQLQKDIPGKLRDELRKAQDQTETDQSS